MKKINESIEKVLEQVKNNQKKIKLGFPRLEDELLLRPDEGRLIFLAARPAMGKTSFALNIAEEFAQSEKRPVFIYSLEMLADEISKRIMFHKIHLKKQSIENNDYSDEDLRELGKYCAILSKLPIYINDSGQTDTDLIHEEVLEFSKTQKPGLIIVDYFQLLNKRSMRKDDSSKRLDIVVELKQIAKTFKIPIIVLSQSNKTVEQRFDKRPTLSDFREGERIISYADDILFLYREAFYFPMDTDHHSAELIIAKSHSGKLSTINLHWEPNNCSFREVKVASDNSEI